MNFPNPVRQKIMAGQPSFGSFLNLVSPMAAEVLVDLGYEWLAVVRITWRNLSLGSKRDVDWSWPGNWGLF